VSVTEQDANDAQDKSRSRSRTLHQTQL